MQRNNAEQDTQAQHIPAKGTGKKHTGTSELKKGLNLPVK